MDREQLVDAERQHVLEELSHLRGLQVNGGSSGGDGAAAAELNAAVAEREARLQDLDDGAAPRAMAPNKTLGSVAGGGSTLTQQQIREIFEFYANFGRSGVMTYQDTIDSFMFMKFARECPGLMDRRLNATEVDMIFTKAKPKFERRLDYSHFLDALAAVADRKYPDYSPTDGLRLLIANHLVPHYEIVMNEMTKTGETEIPLSGVYRKLYDTRSYTGVYAERFRSGDGRINGDTELRAGKHYRGNTSDKTDVVIHDISVLMRPNLHGAGTMMSPANHLLYREKGMRPPTSAAKTAAAMAATRARATSPSGASTARRHSVAGGGSVYSPGGGGAASVRSGVAGSPRGSIYERRQQQAAAAATPARGLSAAPTPAHTPATGAAAATAAGGSGGGISRDALASALAKARAGDPSELIALNEASMTSSSSATPAAVRQQPRQQQEYEGSGSVRGRRSSSSPSGGYGSPTQRQQQPQQAVQQNNFDASSVAAGGAPALSQAQIREIFEFYANFGRSGVMTYQDSIGDFMFNKFARECPGLMDRQLNQAEVDLIFTKAKPKFERRLQFSHFLDALAAMADRKYPDYSPTDGLRLLIANHLVPHYGIVLQEMEKTGETEIPLSGVYRKLYDTRSYTGVYAERFRSGDGRINGDTELRAGKDFRGNTNTGSDQTIHDISVLMRPNLRSGSMMTSRRVSVGGSPRAAVRSVSPRRSSVMVPGGGASVSRYGGGSGSPGGGGGDGGSQYY